MEQGEMKRLLWQCRRGMLEIDILFERFLKQQFVQLNDADKATFKRLLTENDQQIYLWLIEKETPEDAELARIITLIRSGKCE